jgi:hypothetical protein
MLCTACGSSAPDGSRFCPTCGRPLAATEDATRLEPALTRLSDPGLTIASPAVGPLDDFAPGDRVAGRYRIDRVLGRGGMGIVYQAFDERLGHAVALKFLPASLARDPRRLAQFQREVSLARRISHPNVCRVYDIGDVNGHQFLSMEYIEGRDLAATLAARGPYGEAEGVDLVRQIAAGLAAVHAEGVLHRDLKPANIMINRAGEAQLMDFGIASAGDLDETERITEGTPHYMAPEQLRGVEVSAQSDVYALGLVMHEIFTGRKLFESKTVSELVDRQRALGSSVPASLRSLTPSLQEAIRRCLDPDPQRRPASVAEAASMLQVVLLDATATWRRLGQVAAQSMPAPALMIAFALLTRPGTTPKIIAAALLAAAAVAAIVELRFPLGWSVPYKGHTIAFRNHPVFGERLYIDGVMVDRGRVALKVTMRATIERGAGAGERITATVNCGFTSLSCRIVAEAFAAAPAAGGSSV